MSLDFIVLCEFASLFQFSCLKQSILDKTTISTHFGFDYECFCSVNKNKDAPLLSGGLCKELFYVCYLNSVFTEIVSDMLSNRFHLYFLFDEEFKPCAVL